MAKRDTVYDFIYNTVGGNQKMSIIGGDSRYIDEPLFEGTPNELFDSNKDIAREFKSWQADSIWVDNRGYLVITASGGRTDAWLTEYGRDPQGWYEKEQRRLFGDDWKERYS